MKKTIKPVSRRQFLRGTARGIPVFLAMPTLASLMPRETWAAPVAGPKNFFLMYIPDGTFPHKIVDQKVAWENKMALWYPQAGGTLQAGLPLFLKKLEANRADFSIVRGFDGRTGHQTPAYFLTGNTVPAIDLIKTMNHPNDSIDQIIGASLAGSKDASAIQKRVVNATMITPSGGPEVLVKLGHNLTFLNHKPTLEYTSPAKLFKSVFGTALPQDPDDPDSGTKKYHDTLSLVLGDLKAKRAAASSEDKQILDRWVTGYEELKKSIPAAEGSALAAAAAANACDGVKGTAPNESMDSNILANMTADYDKIVMAFMNIYLAGMECGARRVCTLMMGAEATMHGWWNGVVANEDLHEEAGRKITLNDMKVNKHEGMAHYGPEGTDMKRYMMLVTINNYYMRRYAYFINQLKQRQLFDDTLAVCSYSLRDGQHGKAGNNDFPFLVAGKAGGFQVGKHHTNTKKDNPVSNFWVSALKKMYNIDYTNGSVTGNYNGLFG